MNKGRFERRKVWTKCWNIFAVFIGVLSFLAGIGLFVFSLYFYYPICGTYTGITITFLVIGISFTLIHCIKYKFRSEAFSSMIFFLVISMQSLSIISATPNTTCISGADTIFI